MNSKKLARRDELASEHKLGNLVLQRTVMTFKRWVIITGGSMLGFYVILVVIIVLSLTHSTTASPGTDSAGYIFSEMLAVLFVIGVPLVIWFSFYYRMNNSTVALYTKGLVYLGVNKERVALWKDIRAVTKVTGPRGSSYRVIYLTDETKIRLTNLPARGSASLDTLEKFIQEKRGF